MRVEKQHFFSPRGLSSSHSFSKSTPELILFISLLGIKSIKICLRQKIVYGEWGLLAKGFLYIKITMFLRAKQKSYVYISVLSGIQCLFP